MTIKRIPTNAEITQWNRKSNETFLENDRIPFVAEGGTSIVRKGNFVVACARSHTMAKRIANALNQYVPNSEGV